ncbi:MAG: hypothetical protein ABI723_19080 [Bacteroidia bacterium]
MRKEHTDATAPSKQSSKKVDNKQIQTSVSNKRFDAYNKASKAKGERNVKSKPQPAFEYYYDEYDEYLSS